VKKSSLKNSIKELRDVIKNQIKNLNRVSLGYSSFHPYIKKEIKPGYGKFDRENYENKEKKPVKVSRAFKRDKGDLDDEFEKS